MVPLETEFGWNRAVISGAVAINIALFGLICPVPPTVRAGHVVSDAGAAHIPHGARPR
jgi:hypothetical protein